MPRIPAVGTALESIEQDPRFTDYSPTARVLCAVAWADGLPLRPGSSVVDAEILCVAELHVHHGAEPGDALAAARGVPISDADLHGAVRFASSRFADDRLRPALLQLGFRSARELPWSTAVELARWLFTIPADSPDEQATIAAADALEAELGAREEDPADTVGPVIGGCYHCGEPVYEAGPSIAFYSGEKEPKNQRGWEVFSPLVEAGIYESKEIWERRKKHPLKIVKLAREGAPLLCRSCTARAHSSVVMRGGHRPLALIDWPVVPEEELDELEVDAPAATAGSSLDNEADDEPPDELEEQFEIAIALDEAGDARRGATVVDVVGRGSHPLVDELEMLERAIAGTEAALVDRSRLQRVAAGYPEFTGRRGALLIAITALAWERGQPLHLRTRPADVARLERLLGPALRGGSVARALDEERSRS
jgi:hypothetical protein